MHQVTVSAPGKINIYFAVGPLKPDHYHDVVSVYQALNLREQVTVSASDDWQVQVSGALSSEQIAAVPTGHENLVVKAAHEISKLAQIGNPHPVRFEITKNVPVAGGMGGGSADAAAALMAVDELWCTGVPGEKLLDAAAALGADIPFALLGGTALGTGRGEDLRPIEGVQRLHWVLVTNDGGLSTPSVYQRLDQLRAERGEDPTQVGTPQAPSQLLEALLTGDPHQVAQHLHNDLQEAAVDLMPELAQTMQAGLEAGAIAAMVSGSGPTVALLAQDLEHANQVASKLTSIGHNAISTFGPAAGTILEAN